MLRKWMIGAVLASVSGVSFASDWVPIGDNNDFVVSVDRATLKKDGTQVKMWVKSTFKKPLSVADGGAPQGWVVQQWIVNCRDRTFMNPTITRYRTNGNPMDTYDEKDASFQDPAPDTTAALLVEVVCK